MLSDVLCFSKKLIYKKKCRTVKNKDCKKPYHKKSQICISIVYDSFILELSIGISISTALLLWR